jgi:hypothetical protein
MIYIEAPYRDVYDYEKPSLFLAGGITGTSDWQEQLISCIDKMNLDIVVFNPRREYFPIDDPSQSEEQIKWEYDFLRRADIISFWFPPETLCPIVLYELGAWSMTAKPLLVGVHPDYERINDVIIQTRYAKPDINIVHNIRDLSEQIRDAFSNLVHKIRIGDSVEIVNSNDFYKGKQGYVISMSPSDQTVVVDLIKGGVVAIHRGRLKRVKID